MSTMKLARAKVKDFKKKRIPITVTLSNRDFLGGILVFVVSYL